MSENNNPFSSTYIKVKTEQEVQLEQLELRLKEAKIKYQIENTLTLDEYQELLDKHDWLFHYSDNNSIYLKGYNNYNRLILLYNYNDLRTNSNNYWRLFNK